MSNLEKRCANIKPFAHPTLAEKHYRRRPLYLLCMWHIKIEAWVLEQAGSNFKVET